MFKKSFVDQSMGEYGYEYVAIWQHAAQMEKGPFLPEQHNTQSAMREGPFLWHAVHMQEQRHVIPWIIT